MAGNLTGLHVFANDVSPEPLSLLDTNYSAINVAFNALINFSNYYVDSGVANAMAVTVTANQTVSYADGLKLQIQVAATNTGATTLNVNGIGPKNVVDQTGNALVSGALLAGTYIEVIYRSTLNNFQLLSGAQILNSPTLNATVTINAVAAKQSLVVNGAASTTATTIAAGTGATALALTGGANLALMTWSDGTGTGYLGTDPSHIPFVGNNGAGSFEINTNGAVRAVVTSAGNWTFNVPASGTTVTVNLLGLSAGAGDCNFTANSNTTAIVQATNISTGTAGVCQLKSSNSTQCIEMDATSTGYTGTLLTNGPSGPSFALYTGPGGSGTVPLSIGTQATERIRITATGNVTINPPTSGAALAVTGVSGATAAAFTGVAGGGGMQASTTAAAGGGNYAGIFSGITGAARDILAAQQNAFSNGFTVKYDGTQMQYSFLNGNVTIGQPGSGAALLVNGLSANNTITMASTGAAATAGLAWAAGVLSGAWNLYTQSTDPLAIGTAGAANFTLFAAGVGLFKLTTTAALQGFGPVAAAFVDMTPDKSTFTMTLTGMSAATTVTAQWSRNGNQVTINVPVVTGTSNAATFTCTGIPAAIQPANQQTVQVVFADLGAAGPTTGSIMGQLSGGTITWFVGGLSNGFGNTAAKGFPLGATFSYELN